MADEPARLGAEHLHRAGGRVSRRQAHRPRRQRAAHARAPLVDEPCASFAHHMAIGETQTRVHRTRQRRRAAGAKQELCAAPPLQRKGGDAPPHRRAVPQSRAPGTAGWLREPPELRPPAQRRTWRGRNLGARGALQQPLAGRLFPHYERQYAGERHGDPRHAAARPRGDRRLGPEHEKGTGSCGGRGPMRLALVRARVGGKGPRQGRPSLPRGSPT